MKYNKIDWCCLNYRCNENITAQTKILSPQR